MIERWDSKHEGNRGKGFSWRSETHILAVVISKDTEDSGGIHRRSFDPNAIRRRTMNSNEDDEH